MVRRIRTGIGTSRIPVRTDYSTSANYYDAYGKRYIPDSSRLVNEYKRIAYTCANLNAVGVASVPLRLFMKTEGNQTSILRQSVELKSISSSKKDVLASKSYLSKALRSFTNIEEVVKHPILDLLNRVNFTSALNGFRLAELTQLYQEIVGTSYWLITANILGMPDNIWLMPSQHFTPVTLNGSKKLVDYYEYNPGYLAGDSPKYDPADVIPYQMPSLREPYIGGLSPLAAAFESNEVSNKLLTHEDSLLENEARPDAILSPGKDSVFGPEESERLEKEYRMRFARGRNGGIWVVQDEINLTPVSFPPRDLARLEIHKWSKNDVANAFQVPYALIAEASHNRQQLEAAEAQHAKYGLLPRLNRDAATKNDLLVSRFDESGRLFLAYDDPIPENKKEKLEENVQLGMGGYKTVNEIRYDYNLPPLPGGDDLRPPMNVSPELMRDKARVDGSAEK